jgi:putative addiction module killer protein
VIEFRVYQRADSAAPFEDWLLGLEDFTASRIQSYLDRMKSGNFGNSRSVGRGVLELKINFGPGYRVYFLRDGGQVVILLCGGDKGSQERDIRKAWDFAEDYWRRR